MCIAFKGRLRDIQIINKHALAKRTRPAMLLGVRILDKQELETMLQTLFTIDKVTSLKSRTGTAETKCLSAASGEHTGGTVRLFEVTLKTWKSFGLKLSGDELCTHLVRRSSLTLVPAKFAVRTN